MTEGLEEPTPENLSALDVEPLTLKDVSTPIKDSLPEPPSPERADDEVGASFFLCHSLP